jgi:hypothetical protein
MLRFQTGFDVCFEDEAVVDHRFTPPQTYVLGYDVESECYRFICHEGHQWEFRRRLDDPNQFSLLQCVWAVVETLPLPLSPRKSR